MRRHIREIEPPKPSTRLSTMRDEALNTTAQHRQIAAPKLIALIRGDLDWIVMRCRDKDRARRYETANGLADDLRRHLANEPGPASPPSMTYRLGKLIRRNKLVFAAGATVSVSILLGLIVSISQTVRALRAEQKARNEAAISKAVNDFLTDDLLRQSDSRIQAGAKTAPNPDLKAREALDRASEKVGARFQNQPLTEAAVRAAIGRTYNGTGDYAKAARHLERAMQLRRAVLGPEHAETLWVMQNLAALYRDQGKFAEAVALTIRTLEIPKRVPGAEHPDTLTSMNNLAAAYRSQGKFAEAAALHAQTLEIRKRVLGAEHPDTLKSMDNLAFAFRSQGRFAEAAVLQSERLEIQKRVLGAEHADTLELMYEFGRILIQQQKFAEAESVLRQLLASRVKLTPDRWTTSVARVRARRGAGRPVEIPRSRNAAAPRARRSEAAQRARDSPKGRA